MKPRKAQLISKIRNAFYELGDSDCIELVNEIEYSDRPFRLLDRLREQATRNYDKSLNLISNIQDLELLCESEGDE